MGRSTVNGGANGERVDEDEDGVGIMAVDEVERGEREIKGISAKDNSRI